MNDFDPFDTWNDDQPYTPRHQQREKPKTMKYVIRALFQMFVAGLFLYGCLWLIGALSEKFIQLLP